MPSDKKSSSLFAKDKEKEELEGKAKRDGARSLTVANKLVEYNEGKCRADVKLRKITHHLERTLFQNCKRGSGLPRHDRYASYLFRYLVPYDVYCDWVTRVNYVGLLGKEALPRNLRKLMKYYIDGRFPDLSCEGWREVRDVINELLRVKRSSDFFRERDERTLSF